MISPFVTSANIHDFALWKELEGSRFPLAFDLEITARCNNACRHCYINLPAGDIGARSDELSCDEISRIADEAVSMGTLSCLITGGEPLLRRDFADIYLRLKKKGLLVSVFTNATLITAEHIRLFKEYPPRDLEVSVYGVTQETYEKVTGVPGSFTGFMKGLTGLLENSLRPRLKAVALRSNMHELQQISDFCRANTRDYFRFDPLLHLRFDRNDKRNALIRSERLTPDEIAKIEKADTERFDTLVKKCERYISPGPISQVCDHIFSCGAGRWAFTIGYNGLLRVCPSLWHPECMYDLKKAPLKKAWDVFIPKTLDKRSQRPEYIDNCGSCRIINLCLWCPAHAYLETGELDLPVESFCRTAHARAAGLEKNSRP